MTPPSPLSEPPGPIKWWHTASIYEVYPSSFQDSNSDGWGDIPGIISRIPYIASLGVDAVWLSPVYTSPFFDGGYDIADYRSIDPRFGTMRDMDRLIEGLRKVGVKVIMDLVVNHTSVQHKWFEESRKRAGGKDHWYIWRQGRGQGKGKGQEPNNWECQFGGSVWTWDEGRGEYYLHIFADSQPDLNWDNPEVRGAVYEETRFWLAKGVGGFRMDVINLISKPPGLPDAPVVNPDSPYQPAMKLYYNGPRVHEYLRELRKEVLDDYPDAVAIGETPFAWEPAEVRKYVAVSRRELDMVLQYDLYAFGFGPHGKFSPRIWTYEEFKAAIATLQGTLKFRSGAWPAPFLESHDAARSVSRFGDRRPENRRKVAKMLAMLQCTMQGTLFIHQGQEIGLANYAEDIPLEDYKDVETQEFLQRRLEMKRAEKPGERVTMADVVAEVGDQVRLKARDHGRMPIPWEGGKKHAGFTDEEAKPWMPLNTDLEVCNVAQQENDKASVLNFWRRMLAFRKRNPETMVFGDFVPVDLGPGPVFAYTREPITAADDGGEGVTKMLVVLNLGNEEDAVFELPKGAADQRQSFRVLQATYPDKELNAQISGKIRLRAYEGLIAGC